MFSGYTTIFRAAFRSAWSSNHVEKRFVRIPHLSTNIPLHSYNLPVVGYHQLCLTSSFTAPASRISNASSAPSLNSSPHSQKLLTFLDPEKLEAGPYSVIHVSNDVDRRLRTWLSPVKFGSDQPVEDGLRDIFIPTMADLRKLVETLVFPSLASCKLVKHSTRTRRSPPPSQRCIYTIQPPARSSPQLLLTFPESAKRSSDISPVPALLSGRLPSPYALRRLLVDHKLMTVFITNMYKKAARVSVTNNTAVMKSPAEFADEVHTGGNSKMHHCRKEPEHNASSGQGKVHSSNEAGEPANELAKPRPTKDGWLAKANAVFEPGSSPWEDDAFVLEGRTSKPIKTGDGKAWLAKVNAIFDPNSSLWEDDAFIHQDSTPQTPAPTASKVAEAEAAAPTTCTSPAPKAHRSFEDLRTTRYFPPYRGDELQRGTWLLEAHEGGVGQVFSYARKKLESMKQQHVVRTVEQLVSDEWLSEERAKRGVQISNPSDEPSEAFPLSWPQPVIGTATAADVSFWAQHFRYEEEFYGKYKSLRAQVTLKRAWGHVYTVDPKGMRFPEGARGVRIPEEPYQPGQSGMDCIISYPLGARGSVPSKLSIMDTFEDILDPWTPTRAYTSAVAQYLDLHGAPGRTLPQHESLLHGGLDLAYLHSANGFTMSVEAWLERFEDAKEEDLPFIFLSPGPLTLSDRARHAASTRSRSNIEDNLSTEDAISSEDAASDEDAKSDTSTIATSEASTEILDASQEEVKEPMYYRLVEASSQDKS